MKLIKNILIKTKLNYFKNNTIIQGNLTSTIYDIVMKPIILHYILQKCNSTNTSTFNTTYEGIVDNK